MLPLYKEALHTMVVTPIFPLTPICINIMRFSVCVCVCLYTHKQLSVSCRIVQADLQELEQHKVEQQGILQEINAVVSSRDSDFQALNHKIHDITERWAPVCRL